MRKSLFGLFVVSIAWMSFSVYAGSLNDSPDVKYPDPNRWADKIKEFQEWDRKNSFPKDPILFYGSSSIVYWNTADSFPELPVINRGFGGSYTAEALYYVNTLAIRYKPKVIVIYEGDNDIAGSVPPEYVHKDFIALTEAIHTALPNTEIICLAVKLCNDRWQWRHAIKKLNELNKTYSDTKNYITFVDTAAVLLGADQTPNDKCFLADRLHLNEQGYARWNTLLAGVIKEKYAIAMKKSNGQ